MKSKNLLIAVLLVAFVIVLAVGSNGIAISRKKVEPAKVVVVDIEEVIKKSKKGMAFEKQFKAKADAANKELDTLKAEIDLLRDALLPLKRTSEDFAQRQDKLINKQMNLEVKDKFYKQSLQAEQTRWLEKSFHEIYAIIEKIAKTEGYDLVLPRDSRVKNVLYSSEAVNITEEVLAALDRS